MTKSRVIAHTDYTPFRSEVLDLNTGKPVVATGLFSPAQSIQTTESRGNPWPSAKAQTTDVGGRFSTSKISQLWSSSSRAVNSTPRQGATFSGVQWATEPEAAMRGALAIVSPSSDQRLTLLGTKAIANCIPTNPVADAGTFIGELKEGLPRLVGRSLLKSKFKDYRKVGDEYLNVEFGWKPLVSDLQKFGKAAVESDKILKQLHRDSGKDIRRKFSFPDEVVTTESTLSNRLAHLRGIGYDSSKVYNSATGANLRTVTTVTTKTWFSGCFTYHLNLGTSLQDKIDMHAAEARKLFGVELTPATVWNLAPWSWAVDWEGSIGDVLHNVSRFSQDGLVMRYGYIMQSKTAQIHYTLGNSGALRGSGSQDLSMIITAEGKNRLGATPFGFGFDMSALTGRQSAIIGALGLSRGPR